MKIKSMQVQNFRLLRDSKLNLNENVSWLIGKNNTGKTSFLILLDYFYNKRRFDFNDFSKELRKQIYNIDYETDIHQFSIRLLLEIEYKQQDNLRNIAEFITDLEAENTIVKIACEAIIDKEKILEQTELLNKEEKKKFICKRIGEFIKYKVNIYENIEEINSENRYKLVETDIEFVKKLINFQLINAKRDVSSSEEFGNGKGVLSSLTTKYFNSQNDLLSEEVNQLNEIILKLDSDLDTKYSSFFEPFLRNANNFLNMKEIRVESDLESKSLISNSSKVVYGDRDDCLPEYLNGLGYMNILYLLLNIEISKAKFLTDKKDINIFCIEEPEAHTHPQMQYIFAREVDRILKEIPHLQTIISTHSPHMISQCDFSNLKYFKLEEDNVNIINFQDRMLELYSSEKELYNFVKKYLKIESSELFFADKVIFIEGISERILIHYFMNIHDEAIMEEIKAKREEEEKKIDNKNEIEELESQLLLSQNITILEVGANAKAFKKFIEFLGIKCLIITDIDSIKENKERCSVKDGYFTSNATIKEYLDGNNIEDSEIKQKWFNNLVENAQELQNVDEKIKIAYQLEESNYYPRSFEDAFINTNIDLIYQYKDFIEGIRNKENLTQENIRKLKYSEISLYDFIYGKRDANHKLIKGLEGIIVLDGKSSFASSIYYLALKNDNVRWKVPKYIKEGLIWIGK
jgi:overcoming lysogenization defect protein